MARSDRAFPVAVVVPNAALRAKLLAGSEAGSPACAAAAAAAAARLLADVRLWAAHLHLRPMEVPRALHVEWQPWEPAAASSSSTGERALPDGAAPGSLMTATLKKVRGALSLRYAAACDALYAECDAGGATESASHGLSAALRALLPASFEPDARLTFAECGGDSLAAVVFAAALERAGVRVPAAALHDYTLAHIDGLLAAAAAGATLPPAAPARCAVDWDAEMTLPAGWLAAASAAALPAPSSASPSAPRGVFLTGCTGFLGPLLVAEALRQLPDARAPVLCLVRGRSREAARARLEDAAALAGVPVPGRDCGDPAAAAAWASRIRVLVGDIALPHFGLSDADWEDARQSTAAVIHSGAVVDMLQVGCVGQAGGCHSVSLSPPHTHKSQPFARLKAANVGGALTAAELALSSGAPLLFVSSVGALPPRTAAHAASHASHGDGWERLGPAVLDAKSGYGASKAVAEALLFAAAAVEGGSSSSSSSSGGGTPLCPPLDLRVVRPSAISAHRASGFANPRDATNLLLAAMVELGVAPEPAGLPLRWIPADFVAAATVRLALAPPSEASGRAFNLLSAGPPLAVAVDALRAAGYPLRVVPAAAWPSEVARLPPTHRAAPLAAAFARMDVGHDAAPASAAATVEAALPVSCARATLAALRLPWPEPVGTAEAARAVLWLAGAGNLLPRLLEQGS